MPRDRGDHLEASGPRLQDHSQAVEFQQDDFCMSASRTRLALGIVTAVISTLISPALMILLGGTGICGGPPLVIGLVGTALLLAAGPLLTRRLFVSEAMVGWKHLLFMGAVSLHGDQSDWHGLEPRRDLRCLHRDFRERCLDWSTDRLIEAQNVLGPVMFRIPMARPPGCEFKMELLTPGSRRWRSSTRG